MPELFEKTCIKSFELDNRSVRSATWSGVGDEKGYVTDTAVDFYGNLAAGGVGLYCYRLSVRDAQRGRYALPGRKLQ